MAPVATSAVSVSPIAPWIRADVTTTRRLGRRSATAPAGIEKSSIGPKRNVLMRPSRSGESVIWRTSHDWPTDCIQLPTTVSVWAAKKTRKSSCSRARSARGKLRSVDPLGLALPFLLAQHELLHLPRRRLGQVTELDGGRRLEVGDVLLAEVDDLLRGRLLAGLERDEGFRALAPFLVGDGDDRALHHGGMAGHTLLDLDRRDVLAARDDDVLLAVAQLDVAVGVPDADVARVEPAAAERLGGRLGLLEVAEHDVVAPHDDLAQRLAVARDVVHVAVHDAHEVEVRVALALAGGQPRLLLGRQGVPLGVPLAHGVRAVGLGEAVDVYRAEVQLLQLAQQRRRRRGAGHGHRHLPIEPMRLWRVHDADLHGRRAVVVSEDRKST